MADVNKLISIINKRETGGPVKAELTPSYLGNAPLTSATTNVKSGTKASTSKTIAQKNKITSKRDLTAEEYFNPPAPKYSSGDIGLSVLSKIPIVEKLPFIGDKIKELGVEIGRKEGNILLDLGTLALSKNPSLVNYPIIGDFIKDMAYKKASSGSGWVKTNDQILNDTENVYGQAKQDLLKTYIYGNTLYEKAPFKPSDDYLEFLPTYSLKKRYGNTLANEALQSLFEPQKVIINGKETTNIPKNSFVNNIVLGRGRLNKQKALDLEEVIKTHNPKFYKSGALSNQEKNLPKTLFYDAGNIDLGKYKTGFGWDNELNLPYASISDAWDFYPVDYEKFWATDESGSHTGKENYEQFNTPAYQQSYLMHLAGRPYKIYDRTYIDPKTKKAIPDDEILKLKKRLAAMKTKNIKK